MYTDLQALLNSNVLCRRMLNSRTLYLAGWLGMSKVCLR